MSNAFSYLAEGLRQRAVRIRALAQDPAIREELMERVVENDELRERMIELTRENLASGKRPDGSPTPEYSPSYAKRMHKSTPTYDLRVTGALYGSIDVSFEGTSVTTHLGDDAPAYAYFFEELVALPDSAVEEITALVKRLFMEELNNYLDDELYT